MIVYTIKKISSPWAGDDAFSVAHLYRNESSYAMQFKGHSLIVEKNAIKIMNINDLRMSRVMASDFSSIKVRKIGFGRHTVGGLLAGWITLRDQRSRMLEENKCIGLQYDHLRFG